MTIFRCALCGHAGTKETMIVSKHTGSAYCIDGEMCELRKEKRDADARIADIDDERGFEGVGDFYSSDPWDRYAAHQAAKGR